MGNHHSLLSAAICGLALLPLACGDRRDPDARPAADPAASPPAVAAADPAAPTAVPLTPKEQLGKLIFFDPSLSFNRNQSCAVCHGPAWGFTGPNEQINAHGAVYEGSIPGRFGNRAPPSAAYATLSPVFHLAPGDVPTGGNFWDGRATGRELGSPTAEQARGPLLNPVEQALPEAACVVYRVSTSGYAASYRDLWGDQITTIRFPANTDRLCATEGGQVPLSSGDRAKAVAEFNRIARTIAAYEGSREVNSFSSNFDAYRSGTATLTPRESLGLALFEGKAGCTKCHPSSGRQAAFTDFTYDNLGVPANPENPVYRSDPNFVDLGLGGPQGAAPGAAHYGMMKVPTLRNAARIGQVGGVKPYMHNGVFKSLKEVVHFYNTRDVLPTCPAGTARASWGRTCWPPAEVPSTVNRKELGRLGLTPAQEDAIVAFLGTLNDGWKR